MKIAFLGLGAMGSRMAARLLDTGHALTVWNRSPAAADALVAAGATLAPSPRAAAQGVEVVISMLRDDDVSRHVWLDGESGALAGMTPGTLAIESSTLTPGWVRELGQAVAARGAALLEAPVAGSRPAAQNGQLVMLAGGEQAALERAQPLLAVLGSATHHVGPLGAGALAKLATNTLLGMHVAALAEVIPMLRRTGADVEATLKAIAGTPVWAPVDQVISGSILAQAFAPQFPIALLEKDFGYMLDVAGGPEKLPLAQTVRDSLQQAMAAGWGDLQMTALAKLHEG
jgi:3-hydroxyisobutyrate dehydrogenase